MKQITLLIFIIPILFSSCKRGISMTDTIDFGKELQEKIDSATEGNVIELPDGNYSLSHPLVINGAKNITIRGSGRDQTILNIRGMTDESSGINISTNGVVIENLTLVAGAGAAVKAKNAKNVTFRNLKISQSASHEANKSFIAIKAVTSSNIIVEDCDISGISGTGLYVESCQNIVVRKNHLHQCVTGCRITNSMDADISDNQIENNSIGMEINTLPGLSKIITARCRIFNNRIFNNNIENNLPKDSSTLRNASGIGLAIISSGPCEISNNDIAGQNATGIAILSLCSLHENTQDSLSLVYCNGISIHDNKFTKGDGKAESVSPIARRIEKAFGSKLPDIIYDGAVNPGYRNPDGSIKEDRKMCIHNNNNGTATFGNMDIPGKGEHKSCDVKKCDCTLQPLHEVRLN